MPTTLIQLEQDLRRAAEARQYDNVEKLATAFGRAAAAHLAALRPRDPERVKIGRKVAEVLDWALLMMLTARATCLDELSRALVANRYLHQADHPQERLHINL